MKKELKIGIFVICVLSVFLFFVIKTGSLMDYFSKRDAYTVYAKFSTVSGLYPSAGVRLAGVRIGVVTDIYLDGNEAIVKMFIKNKHSLTHDARAAIASVGIVGESFVEIAYKDQYKTDNPEKINDGDFIDTSSSPGLEAITGKFDSMSDKINIMLESVNNIIAQKQSQQDIRDMLANLKLITDNLKDLSAKDGKLDGVFKDADQITAGLKSSIDALDQLVHKLDKSIYNDDTGIMTQLSDVAGKVKTMAGDLETITGNLKQGKGTAGKLLNDEELYERINQSVDSAKRIITQLENKKKKLDKTKLGYFAGIDYFTDPKQTRFAFGVNLDFTKFSLLTRVRENAVDGDPYFTVMAGKRFKYFSAAAGMVDSGLGAALYVHLLNSKLNLSVEASRFYRPDSPIVTTSISYFLTANINPSVGYEDIMEKEGRKFKVGISFVD